MNKEELKKEAWQYADKVCGWDKTQIFDYLVEAYLASAEPREKQIAELEEKISVLLSCKKCPENKGGYICQKEYEDKCLAQKIQFIKELQEENAELKAFRQDCVKLTEDNVVMARQRAEIAMQLTKAKELLNEFMRISKASDEDFEHDYSELIGEAEQFLKDCEVEK